MDNSFNVLLIVALLFGLTLSVFFFLTPLQPPTNLTVISVSPSKVSLTWQSASHDFLVYRSENGKNFYKIGQCSSVGYVDNTVEAGKKYYYMVRAKSWFKESPDSNIISIVVPFSRPESPLLSASLVSETSVEISWKENSKVDYFELYRAQGNSQNFMLLKKFPAFVQAFEDTGLSPNTTYFYKLKAVGKSGKYSFSNVVTVHTGYTITGYVFDENGKALAGVEIKLMGTNRKTFTDEHGEWRFSGLEGEVTVVPFMKRYSFSPNEYRCNGPQYNVDFTAHFMDRPPYMPNVIAPQNGTLFKKRSVKLRWVDSDPDGDQITYDLYFGKSKNPPLLVSNYPFTSYELKNLNYKTTYYWKVVAKDPYGESTQGPLWSFTTPAYKISGFVKYKGKGLKGVEISFGNGIQPVYTDQNGYWMKNGLGGTVNVTPIMQGWIFKPQSITIDQVSTDVNFTATPLMKIQKWKTKKIGKIYLSSPAIGKDGTIYVGSLDGKLYAIDKNGEFLWSFPTNYWIRTSPCIGKNGTIYFASDSGYLYALTPDGKLKWKFPINSYTLSSPSIIDDGTVYVGTNKGDLYAIKKGKELWKLNFRGKIQMSPSIGKDGTIYVGTSLGVLYAIDLDGKMVWKKELSGPLFSSPAIGQNGFIYVATIAPKDGELYCVNSENGEIVWSKNIKGEIYASPIIGTNGTVYIASTDGILYAVKDGRIVWKTAKMNGRIISTPVIGKNGEIYVGTEDGTLYCVNASNGTLAWSLKLKGGIYSSLSLTQSGTLYIATIGNELYAIQTGSLGMEGRWPKYKLDLMNSSDLR